MAPQKQRLYKVTILAYRREGMSEDEYHEHWTKVHPGKVRDWLTKHGIVRYTQYHTPSSVRAEAQEKMKSIGSFTSQNAVDYDGFVELVMPDLQCYENARKDPYYEQVVQPDEESFFDMSKSSITVGWEEVYIEDGKVVDIPPGEANPVTL